MTNLTWEQAVLWLRNQPDQQDLVKFCYYDDPLLPSCERFSLSTEWIATSNYLPSKPGDALDLGAGRGISSYALAKQGWKVTALEPDPSLIVGAGAIRSMAEESGLPINIIEKWGEKLPFDNDSFDLVYGRQVLHHAKNLDVFCSEASRVLRPGGTFIAVREHVISKKEDLQEFLNSHALNFLYGGENAYLLSQYKNSLRNNKLQIEHLLGCYDSPINYFPQSYNDIVNYCMQPIKKILGSRITNKILQIPKIGDSLISAQVRFISITNNAPGRLYSFICKKV